MQVYTLELTLEDNLAIRMATNGRVKLVRDRQVFNLPNHDGQAQRLADQLKTINLDTIAPSLATKIKDFVNAVDPYPYWD